MKLEGNEEEEQRACSTYHVSFHSYKYSTARSTRGLVSRVAQGNRQLW